MFEFRRLAWRITSQSWVLIALLLGCLGIRAQASLLAYEPMNYGPFTIPRFPASGGTGWDERWLDPRGDNFIPNEPGLTYPGLSTQGWMMSRGFGTTSRKIKATLRPDLRSGIYFGKPGTELWISGLIPPNTDSKIGLVGGVGKLNFGIQTPDEVNPDGSLPKGLGLAGVFPTLSTNTGFRGGLPLFLAVRIKFGVGATDSADLYVNPLPGIQPTRSFVQLSGQDFKFDTIWFSKTADEIRLGETYADVAPTKGLQQDSNERWDSRLGQTGPGFRVLCTAISGKEVYAGGETNSIPCVAHWNGNTWRRLDTGLRGGKVRALLIQGTNLFAGGSFTASGTNWGQGIARWTGDHWEPVGNGIQLTGSELSGVYALVPLQKRLIAVGRFESPEGQTYRNVAAWNGATWSGLGSGLGNENSILRTATVWNDRLFVGGTIEALPGGLESGIAYWDEKKWVDLGDGFGGPKVGVRASIEALQVWQGALFVGGRFTSASGTPVQNITRYDGFSWENLGGGIKLSSAIGTNLPVVNTLVPLGKTLLAGGFFTQVGSLPVGLVAEWNGTTWQASDLRIGTVNPPSPNTAAVVSGSASEGNLVISGMFQSITDSRDSVNNPRSFLPNGIALRTADGWQCLRSGIGMLKPASSVGYLYTDLAALPGGIAIAGGFNSQSSQTKGGYVTFWDGQKMSVLGNEFSSPPTCVATMGGQLFAGGQFYWPESGTVNSVARLDGTQWRAEPGSLPSTPVALATFAGKLFVATTTGLFVQSPNGWDSLASFPSVLQLKATAQGLLIAGDSGSVQPTGATVFSTPGLTQWDGATWSIPLPVPGTGNSIASVALTPSGRWILAGYIPALNRAALVAQWDGHGWDVLGTSDSQDARTGIARIEFIGSELYVGGSFSKINDRSMNQVARWDGYTWWPLGDGLLSPSGCLSAACRRVDRMAGFGGDLMLAGKFQTAAKFLAENLALYHAPPQTTSAPMRISGAIAKENVDPQALFDVTLDSPSTEPVTLDFRIYPGTATATADYSVAVQPVVIAPGETHGTLRVAITNDTLEEEDESFHVVLARSSNAIPIVAETLGIIRDDDLVRLLVSDPVLRADSTLISVEASNPAKRYVLQRTLQLSNPEWIRMVESRGNGGKLELVDASSRLGNAFYRVVEESP